MLFHRYGLWVAWPTYAYASARGGMHPSLLYIVAEEYRVRVTTWARSHGSKASNPPHLSSESDTH